MTARTGVRKARQRSLWRHLLIPLLALWVGSTLLSAVSAFWFANRATGQSFDHFLGDDARALAHQVEWHEGRANFAGDETTADSLVFDSLSHSHFLVQTASGRTLVGNATLQTPPTASKATSQPIFFAAPGPNGPIRVAALSLRGSNASDEMVWVLVGEPQAARTHASREMAAAIFVPTALLGLIVIPLLYLGIRLGLAPTRDINVAVAQRGIHDLSPLPLDKVPDELRGMVQHTNDLLHRLDDAIAEQRRFISDAAHQLQTPIAGIRLLTDDLRRTQQADPTQPADAEVLTQLSDAATRASQLVRQLLAMARLEATLPEADPFDVWTVLTQTTASWRLAVEAAGKTLRLQPHADNPLMVNGSPMLLGEVIGNLIDNARRYGGAEIELSVQALDGQVQIRVEDNGPALDAQTHADMFRPFWRGDHGQPDGSGLGLSIAQRLIERSQGSINAKPRADGSGTCIELRLPGI